MPSIKAKNIYDVINPIHSLSRIIGLTSFSIKKDNHENYGGFVSFYDVLCLIISTTWNVLIVMWFIFSKQLWELKHEFMSSFFENCSLIVNGVQITILALVNLRFFLIKEKFVLVLSLIKDVDEVLLNMNATVDHKKHQKCIIAFLVSASFVNIIGGVIAFITGDLTGAYASSYLMFLADFVSTETFILLFSQFMFFMWSIKIRYHHLNSILVENFGFETLKSERKVSREIQILTTCAVLHNKLAEVSKRLSSIFGIPVSLSFRQKFK